MVLSSETGFLIRFFLQAVSDSLSAIHPHLSAGYLLEDIIRLENRIVKVVK